MIPRRFIPFNLPSIGDEEIEEVTATLRSGWLTTGPRTAQFESEFASYVGAHHALAVNSCTAGLHLALAALGIGPGDEVITTPLTFCATVNTIIQVGATPVLADVDADGNLDPASVARHINGRTRAIMPVHLAGLPCEMTPIWQLARRHNLRVIEDAAHAVGAAYGGRLIGATIDARQQSDAVAFSFYATKNLTTGEGGMVTCASRSLVERMRVLCLHGMSKDAWNRNAENGSWRYQVVECGFKYNLSDLQSAIGIHQLRKIDGFTAARARYARMYDEALGGLEEVSPPGTRPGCRHAWHLYMVRLNLDKLKIDRDEVIAELHRKNIGASVHFIPIPLHPFFVPYMRRNRNHCPRALKLYPRLVSLPLYPAMTVEEVQYVSATLREIILAGRKPRPAAMRAGATGVPTHVTGD